MAVSVDGALEERLSAALPKNLRFTIHHLCSESTPCSPLFSPAPNRAPENTFCESQFLSVSIDINGSKVQAFALEVLIYTTDTLTTIFVSKADSTGCLHLLKLPKVTPSPFKATVSTFLELLVERKRRSGVRLVLSLFARAQDQYLFPGSIENNKKHVLDDRGLIKWWCQILDKVLQACPIERPSSNSDSDQALKRDAVAARGFLRVPGCDAYDTRAFFPDYAKRQSSSTSRWVASDPLRALGKPLGIPERCLIPRFPDDPKARFVIDLDDELPENSLVANESPSKSQLPGKWRSVRSLEQFWEMMAFRQECAAGRLVGFIWAVFVPKELIDRTFDTGVKDDEFLPVEGPSLPIPLNSQVPDGLSGLPQSPLSSSSPQLGLLPTPTPSSQLQEPVLPLDTPRSALAENLLTQPIVPMMNDNEFTKTTDSNIATATSVTLILPEPVYIRITSLLQRLDYADIALATESTLKWIAAATAETKGKNWGVEVVGMKDLPLALTALAATKATTNSPVMLNSGLLRRNKRRGTVTVREAEGERESEGVTVLSAGLVRKKPKI